MVDSLVNTDYTGLVRLVNLNLLRPQMLVSLYLATYRGFLHIWFVLTKSPQPGSHPKGRTSEVVGLVKEKVTKSAVKELSSTCHCATIFHIANSTPSHSNLSEPYGSVMLQELSRSKT